MISAEVFGLMLLAVCAIILMLSTIAIVIYEVGTRNKVLSKTSGAEKDWLFSNIHETIYNIMVGKEPSGTSFGIRIDDYKRYCQMLRITYEPKKLIGMKIEGFAFLIISILISYLMLDNLMIAGIVVLVGVLFFVLLYMYPYSKIKNDAEERLYKVKDDLPRFLSLLEKALDFPVDQAILITARKFPSPLSDDLLMSLSEMSLGAGGWEDVLVELARTYQIETFNDVVLEIISAHKQGINIRPLVERKCVEIEKVRLYDMEAHDSKVKSMIYLPVMALKIVPLMGIICIPMLMRAQF